HLGRKLYDRSRHQEQEQFLNWLLEIIQKNEVELLLVAGDIFDSAVPGAQAVDLYYQFLFNFYQQTRASAVIIAGNHDSATRLAAPREFLKMARIHVAGSVNKIPEQNVVLISNAKQTVAIIALPYLPEGELTHISFESEVDSANRYREAVRQHYSEAIKSLSPAIPKILMGHFFVSGSQANASRQVVQVGGSLPVSLEDFPTDVKYIALGHLHHAQKFSRNEYPVIYSGSPLPYSFDDATDMKKIFLVDVLDNQPVEIKEILVPTFRELVRLSGNYDEIIKAAEEKDWDGKLIEIQIQLDVPRIGLSDAIRKAFADKGGEVASVQAQLLSLENESALSAEEVTSQSPQDIFHRFYLEQLGEPGDNSAQENFSAMQNLFNELIQLWKIQQVVKEEME
ncbi:exonuclease SbcCD subunit D C-terminal domain-containing protein, partial [candidate division KSB1 bacterium]|nr:exonuclease SbcCD subunit D C-terminal domain-containing protein [candidate division KSB1 bacterium]